MNTDGAMRTLDETRGAVRLEDLDDTPRHLLVRTEPGTDDEGQIEAWLTEEAAKTRLVVEERGLPVENLPFHASGWQVHLDDLGRSLDVDGPVHPEGWNFDAGAPGWKLRWQELTPTYQQTDLGSRQT